MSYFPTPCSFPPLILTILEGTDPNECVMWKNRSKDYVFFNNDPGQYLVNNYKSFIRVRQLAFQLPDHVEKLSDCIGVMTELTHLYISHSKHLKYLPDSIIKLQKLEVLSVTDCQEFVWPQNLDQLSSLKHLTLGVGDIKSLPDVVFNLFKLESLRLHDMLDVLTNFPAKIDRLVGLRSLSFYSCELKSLPDSVTKLPLLDTLELHYTHFLEPLPTLNLRELKLICCSLSTISAGLNRLEVTASSGSDEAADFDMLDYLERHLDQFACLKRLSISYCGFKFLATIPRLRNLQELVLKDCSALHELPGNLHELVDLCILNVSYSGIRSLPRNITRLHKLRQLILKNCYNIQELPENLEELVRLCTLNLSGTKVRSLPCCVTKLPNLWSLSLPKCFRLETLPTKLYESVLLSIDGMVMDLNDEIPTEGGNEDNESVVDSAEEANSEESGQRNTIEQTIAQAPLNQLDTSQLLEESRDGTKDLIGENNEHELLPSCSKMWVSRSDDEVSREPFCDDLKVKKRKIEITREVIQPFLSKQMRLVDVAKDLGVSRSTIKRQMRKLGISSWPSTKNKSNNNNGKSSNEKQASKLNNDDVDENLSKFIVKATYMEDTVRFEFCYGNTLDELKEKVGKNLKLELNKFKIKYEDTDNEWMLMSMDSHLDYALSISKSYGNNLVRLLITPL